MKDANKCAWLLMGKTELCGKSCVRVYCGTHHALASKGGGTVACTGCGIGVKTSLALCNGCGATVLRVKKWRERQRFIREEYNRLIAQDPQSNNGCEQALSG